MIVALVIGLILTFTAVMPLVSDYSDAKTFKNEGYYNMDIAKTGDTHTIFWDHTAPNKITVDGVDINLPTYLGSWTIIGSDNFMARYLVQSNNTAINIYASNNISVHAQTSDGTDMSMTVTADSFTAANTKSTPESISLTDLDNIYYINPNGEYVMKYSNTPAYLTDESVIGICRTTSDGVAVCYSIFGTIKDGFEISQFYGNTATFGDITVNDTEISDYVGLYQLNDFKFSITNTDGSTEATVSYFIVPSEVTANPDNPAVYKNLVSVLPLFALILLVAGAASLVYFKNKD